MPGKLSAAALLLAALCLLAGAADAAVSKEVFDFTADFQAGWKKATVERYVSTFYNIHPNCVLAVAKQTPYTSTDGLDTKMVTVAFSFSGSRAADFQASLKKTLADAKQTTTFVDYLKQEAITVVNIKFVAARTVGASATDAPKTAFAVAGLGIVAFAGVVVGVLVCCIVLCVVAVFARGRGRTEEQQRQHDAAEQYVAMQHGDAAAPKEELSAV
jgi:hypothetical protein